MSKPAFCSQCYTLLVVGKNNQQGQTDIHMGCHNCGSAEPLTKTTIMKKTDHTRETVRYLNKAMTYDQTLRRTCVVTCANEQCPTHTVPWGTVHDDILVQPNVSLTNFFSDDRIMTYICNICSTTWQPVRG